MFYHIDGDTDHQPVVGFPLRQIQHETGIGISVTGSPKFNKKQGVEIKG